MAEMNAMDAANEPAKEAAAWARKTGASC
jgi:hypothetical protein